MLNRFPLGKVVTGKLHCFENTVDAVALQKNTLVSNIAAFSYM